MLRSGRDLRGHGLDRAGERGVEEPVLVAVVGLDHPDVGPGLPGDPFDAPAGVAVLGELRDGRLQDPSLRRLSVTCGHVVSVSVRTFDGGQVRPYSRSK